MSEQGLITKYHVFKNDNGEIGELVTDCFVLRPDKDEAAKAALLTYAAHTANKALRRVLFEWFEARDKGGAENE